MSYKQCPGLRGCDSTILGGSMKREELEDFYLLTAKVEGKKFMMVVQLLPLTWEGIHCQAFLKVKFYRYQAFFNITLCIFYLLEFNSRKYMVVEYEFGTLVLTNAYPPEDCDEWFTLLPHLYMTCPMMTQSMPTFKACFRGCVSSLGGLSCTSFHIFRWSDFSIIL